MILMLPPKHISFFSYSRQSTEEIIRLSSEYTILNTTQKYRRFPRVFREEVDMAIPGMPGIKSGRVPGLIEPKGPPFGSLVCKN